MVYISSVFHTCTKIKIVEVTLGPTSPVVGFVVT
jgi:hypothetical protein